MDPLCCSARLLVHSFSWLVGLQNAHTFFLFFLLKFLHCFPAKLVCFLFLTCQAHSHLRGLLFILPPAWSTLHLSVCFLTSFKTSLSVRPSQATLCKAASTSPSALAHPVPLTWCFLWQLPPSGILYILCLYIIIPLLEWKFYESLGFLKILFILL